MKVRNHHISLPMIVTAEKTSFFAGAQETTSLLHKFTEHIPKSAIMTSQDISTMMARDSMVIGAGLKTVRTGVNEREEWEAETKR